MNRPLLWKFWLIIATGIVAMYYIINVLTLQAEEDMSLLNQAHQDELTAWGKQAEAIYATGDRQALVAWIGRLQDRENTWVSVVSYSVQRIAGDEFHEYEQGFYLGRNVSWRIHLYFEDNPIMEIPFTGGDTSFLVRLPARMRPGSYWPTVRLTLQVLLPMLLLALLSIWLYWHIMQPLRKLQGATQDFSRGNFSVRVHQLLGNRKDELSELANTFDQMAARIGQLIVNQRQLIADLSHELRTPLTRLEIAVANARSDLGQTSNLERIERESRHIRRLVEDTLTLAWLENEQPVLPQENLDLMDLIDVIIDDASFEFPDRTIQTALPNSAPLRDSNHRAVGQALENIVRNALRFTPEGEAVQVNLRASAAEYRIEISDKGPGVPEELLETIFQPFFRVDKSRAAHSSSFGLGLSLARRQLATIGGTVSAANQASGGLCVAVVLPKE